MHARLHGGILRLIGDELQSAQNAGECRSADGHAELVAERHKGVLEAVVAHAGFPLAVLHAVGHDGVNRGVEAAEEELRERGKRVKRHRGGYRAEEIQGNQ